MTQTDIIQLLPRLHCGIIACQNTPTLEVLIELDFDRMKVGNYPKFKNDNAVTEIRIGAKEFKCIGVSPPQDHPHVYLDMGDDDSILCPYCATRFRFDSTLGANEANPLDAIFVDEAEGY